MAKEVVMPALGMAQDTGTLLQWLKQPGDPVSKGELLMVVETDKASVEIEATASGTLAGVTANAGDVIPVGQRIAVILGPGEQLPPDSPGSPPARTAVVKVIPPAGSSAPPVAKSTGSSSGMVITATPLAARLAAEHGIDLSRVNARGGQVRKEDVLAYLTASRPASKAGRVLASPLARRLGGERGLDLRRIPGSGPEGAVLAADLQLASRELREARDPGDETPRIWRVMVERLSQAWSATPQFYLVREVNAGALVAWRKNIQPKSGGKVTFTDLLVRLAASALQKHPRMHASWLNDRLVSNPEINIGLAVAVAQGLVVPVIHRAETLDVEAIARRREELVQRAQAGRLALDDLSGGTFTISNLGMYAVDAFIAIVNPPQAAILAVGRIADRVVAVDGKPAVQPMMTLTLSCDHRVVDGARAAEFLQTLAGMIEGAGG